VDFVGKPKSDIAHSLESYADELIGKVRVASMARVQACLQRSVRERAAGPAAGPGPAELRYRTTEQIIAIGASTGGTEAIRTVLIQMPPDSPGMVITQHIPRAFSGQFAARMDTCSQMSVKQAEDGDLILPGHAYIAPGDQHLIVMRDGARYRCQLSDDAPVNHHRPSVDVMFHSVAQNVGRNAIGVILTGMGADGSRGLKAMREQGAATLAQDERSSVVWGMPGAAVAIDAVERVLPVEQIAEQLLRWNQHREERLAAGS